MTRSTVRTLVTLLALAALVVTAVALAFPETPGSEQPPLANALFGDVYLALGAVVFWQRPQLVLPRVMIGLGLVVLGATLVQVTGLHVSDPRTTAVLEWLSTASYLALGLGLGLIVYLFPTGRPPSRGWRWPVRALVLGTVALIVGTALEPQALAGPIGAVATATGLAVYAVGLLLAIPSLGVRFWRSQGTERAQVKWFLLAVVVATVAWITTTVLGAVLMLVLPPLGITVALTRYRLYDIDRVISRTASYAIVTGVLLATYAVTVTSVTRLLPDSSTFAVAGATLAAAALARPIYRGVRASIDRRFNRARYDAERTVEAFGHRLRAEIDTPAVLSDLRGVVHDTLEPESVGVWLRSPS
jgi:hypothetical protein